MGDLGLGRRHHACGLACFFVLFLVGDSLVEVGLGFAVRDALFYFCLAAEMFVPDTMAHDGGGEAKCV